MGVTADYSRRARAPLPGPWVADAYCGWLVQQGWDPDWWHPQNKSWLNPEGTRYESQAVRICMMCPVRVECGDYGRRHKLSGIWGGRRLT